MVAPKIRNRGKEQRKPSFRSLPNKRRRIQLFYQPLRKVTKDKVKIKASLTKGLAN